MTTVAWRANYTLTGCLTDRRNARHAAAVDQRLAEQEDRSVPARQLLEHAADIALLRFSLENRNVLRDAMDFRERCSDLCFKPYSVDVRT